MNFCVSVISLFHLATVILIKDYVVGTPPTSDRDHDAEIRNKNDELAVPKRVFEEIDKAVKEALRRRFSKPKLTAVATPPTPPPPKEPRLLVDQPVFEAITQAFKEALNLILTKSALETSSNSSTDQVLPENMDQAIRDALTRRLLVSQTQTQPSAAPSTSPEVGAIDQLVEHSLRRILSKTELKESENLPMVDETLIQAVYETVRDAMSKRSLRPSSEEPNSSSSPSPVAVRGPVVAPVPQYFLAAVDKAVQKVLIGKLSQVGLHVPDEYLTSNQRYRTAPETVTRDCSLAEDRPIARSPPVQGESSKSSLSTTDASINKLSEPSSKPVEKKESQIPSAGAKDERVTKDRKKLLLRPKERDSKDAHIIKIKFPTYPTNVQKFPSDATLLSFKTEEEADLFRKALEKSAKFKVEDAESAPLQVWISNLPQGLREDEVHASIAESFNEPPSRIRFLKADDGNLKIAHVEVSAPLQKKMVANPYVQIRKKLYDIDTSVVVKRCSRCWLLGHGKMTCKNLPRLPFYHESVRKTCYDCVEFNKLLMERVGNRRAASLIRDVDHLTDSETCPTKISLNEESKKQKLDAPYLE